MMISILHVMSYLTQSQFTSQILATEIYKLINNISRPVINKVFKLNSDSHYNLRQFSQFSRYLVFSEFFYLGRKIWSILPDDKIV